MKSIMLWLASCLLALSVVAQNSTVTIRVRGNTSREIFIDGNRFTVDGNVNSNANVNTPIVLNSLSAGEHTLRIVYDNNRQNDYITHFNLRTGYDITINVNANGTVRTIERISGGEEDIITHSPMSTANFNTLLQQVRYQRSTSRRTSAVQQAFSNTNNYFTSSQARQLITYVSSQNIRLELAKAAYPMITDPDNFSQVSNLLYGTARRQELNEYISSYGAGNQSYPGYKSPMSNNQFNILYRSATQQYPMTQRRTYIANSFAGVNNYFTTAQIIRLIGLVNDEASRLFLAKAAYRGVTDPENFSQVNSLLYSQSSRNELEVYTNTYGGNGSNTYRKVWTDSYYNSIYNEGQRKWPSSSRMTYLSDIFANNANYFTAYQGEQLMRLVNAETDRLQLAKLAYRGLNEPTTYTEWNDLFIYQSSRNELANYVSRYQPGSTTPYRRLAMTDDEFRANYRTVQAEWLPGGKMSALVAIFDKQSNYFTSTQARQLIQLVSAESNRLQLAKSAYDNIVDPENIAQLNDLFVTQGSRDELSTYISNHPELRQ